MLNSIHVQVSGETDGEAGLKKVAFEKTPKMSTYLLAMVHTRHRWSGNEPGGGQVGEGG